MTPLELTAAAPMPWGTLLLALWPLWAAFGAVAALAYAGRRRRVCNVRWCPCGRRSS